MTSSKQPPEVTSLLLQRQLHKLRAGAGTDRNVAQQNRKLSCQQVPFSGLQAGTSPIHSDGMGLPYERNANYQLATVLQRSGTRARRRDTFHREIKYSLFCILDLTSLTITKYSPLNVQTRQKFPSFTVIRKPPDRKNTYSMFVPAWTSSFA